MLRRSVATAAYGSEVVPRGRLRLLPRLRPKDDRRHWSTEDAVTRGPVCLATMTLVKLTIVCLPLPALSSSHP